MKSDKWKAIVISDTRLRKIRKNLRLLLKLAVENEFNRLKSLENLYRSKRLSIGITASQWKREVSLSRAVNKLLQLKHRSNLQCSEGSLCVSPEAKKMSHDISSLNKDMVWNPLLKEWICIDCYNHYYNSEIQKQELKQHLERDDFKWEEIRKELPKDMSKREISQVVESLKKNEII